MVGVASVTVTPHPGVGRRVELPRKSVDDVGLGSRYINGRGHPRGTRLRSTQFFWLRGVVL